MTIVKRTEIELFVFNHKIKTIDIATRADVSRTTVYQFIRAPKADLMSQSKREDILAAIVSLAGEIGVDVTAEELLDEVGS